MPRITHDREQIHRFFELLYGDVERESARLPVWHTKPREGRPDKKFPVLWSADTSSAADAVAGISPTHGIYFGVCWHDPALVEAAVRLRNPDEAPQVLANRLSYSRGFADTTTVMPGLWLDVDFGTDGHSSVDYPAYCVAVGRAVVGGEAERGIVLGGSGQGRWRDHRQRPG